MVDTSREKQTFLEKLQRYFSTDMLLWNITLEKKWYFYQDVPAEESRQENPSIFNKLT